MYCAVLLRFLLPQNFAAVVVTDGRLGWRLCLQRLNDDFLLLTLAGVRRQAGHSDSRSCG